MSGFNCLDNLLSLLLNTEGHTRTSNIWLCYQCCLFLNESLFRLGSSCSITSPLNIQMWWCIERIYRKSKRRSLISIFSMVNYDNYTTVTPQFILQCSSIDDLRCSFLLSCFWATDHSTCQSQYSVVTYYRSLHSKVHDMWPVL